MADKFLEDRVTPVDVEKTETISDLLNAFSGTSFQSRNLARCVEIFTKMLTPGNKTTILLGLAGAMVPAGMKKVVSTMIRKRMVHVIVTTGANAYHDLVEALGFYHYKGSPYVNDAELHKHGIDRIYDTFASENEYRLIDDKIEVLADRIQEENPHIATISSRTLMFELGKLIDKEGLESEKHSSILWNAWRHETPIFVPALCDSSIGLGITKHHINSLKKGVEPLVIDQILDNYEIYEIKRLAEETGVIYIGGGVPKNYIQQTAYLEMLTGAESRGHRFGFQITTDRPEWGGLSGCTFREGVSWGKIKEEGEFVTCYCDATIALPLIVRAVLEKLNI